ncbi:MAG: hypothetical protein R3D85_10115 [Paracoccaceae bacterium]
MQTIPGAGAGLSAPTRAAFAALGEATAAATRVDWGVYGAPETFIIDGNGVVLVRWAGPITPRVLQENILPAIEAAKGAPPGLEPEV